MILSDVYIYKHINGVIMDRLKKLWHQEVNAEVAKHHARLASEFAAKLQTAQSNFVVTVADRDVVIGLQNDKIDELHVVLIAAGLYHMVDGEIVPV